MTLPAGPPDEILRCCAAQDDIGGGLLLDLGLGEPLGAMWVNVELCIFCSQAPCGLGVHWFAVFDKHTRAR